MQKMRQGLWHKLSLSSRRAWIEIATFALRKRFIRSLSSRRAWIEIVGEVGAGGDELGRSPHGERGLKSAGRHELLAPSESLSSRRAWIEIRPAVSACLSSVSRSPHGERGLKCVETSLSRVLRSRSPHGERGLKSHPPHQTKPNIRSLSSRRAWIEIRRKPSPPGRRCVALLTESVD